MLDLSTKMANQGQEGESPIGQNTKLTLVYLLKRTWLRPYVSFIWVG